MWILHSFCQPSRAVPEKTAEEFEDAVHAFSDSIIQHFGGEARWVVPDATNLEGRVDVWFNIPVLPIDAMFRDFWDKKLCKYGLSEKRITVPYRLWLKCRK